ncbi:unnamed protein product [Gongylonema pulchrum]|uniref:B9 domain-containing protein 1 n=1 Tax=Gongylonema pulchrum TaxID=637853 RepID=A0A183ESD9_9BILA|nr:unnamed protein product [Gongylonema pulchrum]
MSVEHSKSSNFIVLLSGQIESAQFHSFDNLYCKYSYVYGADWEQVAGVREGLSAKCECGRTRSNIITIAMPFEATFTSTNPFGWPQIVLSCYGLDCFGNDIVCGYGATHIPTVPGRTIRRIAMFVPEASTPLQRFLGWITGKRAEFVDPRIVATGTGRQGNLHANISNASEDFCPAQCHM